VQLHGAASAATLHAIERESERFLNPLRGFTLRSSNVTLPAAGGVELAGVALSASAMKESEDGRAIVLRCVNLTDRDQPGSWTLPVDVESAQLARLDETPVQRVDSRQAHGRTIIDFTAGPRAVVTIIVTPRR
jgi:hypothetical protein